MRPALILLNGPPAVGKSTVADRLVAGKPLALNLDIDVIRAQLGGWLDQPSQAGLLARALTVAMARTHLSAGYHVVVPQFLARAGFIERLEALAGEVGAAVVEIVLDRPRDEALANLERRSSAPEHQGHADAARLLAATGDTAGAMYDRLTDMLAGRPSAVRVRVIADDVDATVAAVEAVIVRSGCAW